jgi:hypothetical protein
LRPPAGARAAAAARSRGPGSAGGRHPQRGAPGRYARPKGGAGGADGPTAPTQWGPGRPGAPAPQPARGRSNARPGQRPAPQGLGLALRRGAPVQRLRPNLTGPGPAGARPWAAHYPGQPPQGDGRGGRRHAAAQGGQGCGPLAAGGGWDGPEGRTGAPTTARRRWPPSRCPQQLPAMGAGCGE